MSPFHKAPTNHLIHEDSLRRVNRIRTILSVRESGHNGQTNLEHHGIRWVMNETSQAPSQHVFLLITGRIVAAETLSGNERS